MTNITRYDPLNDIDNLFKGFNVGLGSAISVLIFCCAGVIALIFIKVFGAAAPGGGPDDR